MSKIQSSSFFFENMYNMNKSYTGLHFLKISKLHINDLSLKTIHRARSLKNKLFHQHGHLFFIHFLQNFFAKVQTVFSEATICPCLGSPNNHVDLSQSH